MEGGQAAAAFFARWPVLFAAIFAQHAEFARQRGDGLDALAEPLGGIIAYVYIK